MPFYLLNDEPIDAGLRRIAAEQINTGLRDFADGNVPAARKVHSMRIRCKKLRGLLRLLQPLMQGTVHEEDQRLREAARELATNRDREVFARTIASLIEANETRQAEEHPVQMDNLERSAQLLRESLDAVDTWPVRLHGFHDVAPGFARTYRKCLSAREEVLQDPSDGNFHRFRRWTKYHWHQVRILERLDKQALRPRRKRLRKLQLMLGDAHDLALTEAILLAEAQADGQLLRRARRRKRDLYANVLRSGRSVFAVSVDELVADCARYWADRPIKD